MPTARLRSTESFWQPHWSGNHLKKYGSEEPPRQVALQVQALVLALDPHGLTGLGGLALFRRRRM